jgi:ACS family glucarate transporter-like MFS transporter
LVLLSFVTIIDRVCISAAKHDMALDLHITDVTFGLVFGAFAVGYGVFMTPSGWLADRLGPRRFLAIIVVFWSLFTLLTGLVSGVAVLVLIRFLFGGAEAGAFPAAAKAIRNWLPVRERGFALGLLNTGSRLGAAAGLAAVSFSVTRFGWRSSFAFLGTAGFVWACFWYGWFRDHPETSREVERTDWRELISTDSAIILGQYFASNFTFFICFSWLLPYVRDQYALSAGEAAVLASIPLYCGALATWTSGLVVDTLYRRGMRRLSRRLPAMAGFALACGALIAAAFMTDANGFITCFAAATFGVDFTLSPSWTACADLGGRRTGTLSAAMNTMGSAGSFVSSVAFPWLLAVTGNIKTYFFAAAFLNVLAVAGWLRIGYASGKE